MVLLTKFRAIHWLLFWVIFQNASPASANVLAGTAFFYNDNGDMFTNRHVVEECKLGTIKVRTYDKRWYPARLIAQDDRVDIAAISIDRKVDAFASFRLFPGTRSVTVPEETEDVFSAGFSDPVKKDFKVQYKWGQIQNWRDSNAFPYVNRMRMDAYPGASGSAVLDYYGLLVGIVFASSGDPASDYKDMRKSGYGDKWIFIHNLNAITMFANKHKLQYSAWDKWERKDPVFIWGHADRITGLVVCETARHVPIHLPSH